MCRRLPFKFLLVNLYFMVRCHLPSRPVFNLTLPPLPPSLLSLQDQPALSLAGVRCAAALSVDPMLQMELLKGGALWHLMPRLFQYDYTLAEGGVNKQHSSNAQVRESLLAVRE